MLEWMYWSLPSAIFTILFVLMLVIMYVLDKRGVLLPRAHLNPGFLRTPTTFGERLFIAIVFFVFVGILWLAILPNVTIVGAGILGAVVGAIVVKWG